MTRSFLIYAKVKIILKHVFLFNFRYKLFTKKKKIPNPKRLPPTRDALMLHFKVSHVSNMPLKLNANLGFTLQSRTYVIFITNISYLCDCNWTRTHDHLVQKRTLNHLAKLAFQTKEWKNALTADHIYIDPIEHGWQRKNDGLIEIKWTTLKAGPNSLLEFMVCICQKSQCKTNVCKCKRFNLKCTDLCGCKDCNTQEEKPIESDHEESDESENEESDFPDDENLLLTDNDNDDDF